MHFGPHDVLMTLSLDFENAQPAPVESTVSRLEGPTKLAYPEVTRVFVKAQSFAASRVAASSMPAQTCYKTYTACEGPMKAYREVKLFDLDDAPDFIRDAIRPIALAHVSTMDATSIWEVTVGSYDWQDAAEEWALHRWLKENGATDGEFVLVKLEQA